MVNRVPRVCCLHLPGTLYEGDIVSVHRMVMENRPVDPGSIQGSHRPISFIRIKHRTRANDIFCAKLSINNHIVGLVHKNHIIRTCLMYHAACKVEFQPFTKSYSQLTFFNFLYNGAIPNGEKIRFVLFLSWIVTFFLSRLTTKRSRMKTGFFFAFPDKKMK